MKTKSLKIRRLLLATIALVMLLSTAAMAKTITLKYDKSNKMYAAAYTATKDETINFKMPAKYSGRLLVTGGYRSSYSSNIYGISETLYNAKGYRLDYYSSNYVNFDSDIYETYAITPGNYYFRVKAYKGNTYVLGVKYIPKVVNSPKGGSSKARAYTLTRNKAVSGIISAAGYKQAKWFKFYVPKQSRGVKLRVLLQPGGQGRTKVYVAGPGLSSTQYFTIWPEDNRQKWYDLNMYTQVSGSRYYKTGPKAGTYYALVTKEGGGYKYSSSQFAIRWSYYNF